MPARSSTLWGAPEDAWLTDCRAAVAAGDLARALFALSLARPAEVRAARVRLAAWGQAVLTQRLAGLGSFDALHRVLVDGAELQGDADTYFHSSNADLACVIARGRGMPILVSAVWMLCGLAAGIEVHGIGLPGHFIARVDADQLIDPFDGGRLLSLEDCQAIAARATGGVASWDDRHLRPVSITSLVARVIRNRVGCAQREGDGITVYRFARLGAGLTATDVGAQLTWAQAAEQIGARGEAMRLYLQIARQNRGTPPAQVASARAAALVGHQDSLH